MSTRSIAFALALGGSALPLDLLAETSEPGSEDTPSGTLQLPGTEVSASYGASTAVIGTKTDTPLIQVPQSVGVVNETLLEERRPMTLLDALYNVSGVSDSGTRRGFDNLSIRGFTASSSVYLDGLRVERGNFNVQQEPYGLERVEVLKGPGSVLYGQGSLGGIVNQVSKKPTLRHHLDVEVGAGTDGTWLTGVDTGGQFGDSAFSGRLVGLYRERGDDVDYNDKERFYLSPSLTWQGEDTTLTLLSNFTRDRHEGAYVGLPIQGTIESNPNGSIDRSRYIGEPGYDGVDIERYQLGYQLEHLLDQTWTLRQSTRYTDSDVFSATTFSQGLDSTQRYVNRGAAEFTSRDQSLAIDTNLQGRFIGEGYENVLLMGADLLYQDVDSRFAMGSFAPMNLYAPVYGSPRSALTSVQDYQQDDKLYGLYLQNQLHLGDRLTLLAGVRYDHSETDNDNHLTDASRTQRDEDVTFRAGATYEVVKGVALFASYSEAFNPNFGLDPEGKPFDAETGKQYEVGVKTDLLDGRVRTTTSVYQLTRDNVLVAFPLFPGTQIQTGQQRSRGFETDIAVDLTERLSATVAYAYTDVEVRKDSNEALIGDRPINIPTHQANLWLAYSMPVMTGNLTLGGGARYVADREGTLPNTYSLPDYTVFDAALTYRLKNWRLQLNAYNLTDKEYISSASPTGTSSVMYGEARQLLATVGYSF